MLHTVKVRLSSGVAVVALVAIAMACGATAHKGSLVIGLDTDVSVPANVDGIGIQIAVNGNVKYSKLFAIDPEVGATKRVIKLPATIAVVDSEDGETQPVAIRAVAFHLGQARIVRDVVSTVPHNRTALLRVPLRYLGYNDSVTGSVPVDKFVDVQPKGVVTVIRPEDDGPTLDTDLTQIIGARCSLLEKETNVDGECVDSTIDSTTLPDYVETDLYANGLDANGVSNAQTCFDVPVCFASSAVAGNDVKPTKTATSCTVPLVGSADGLNVGMVIAQPTMGQIGFCADDGKGGKRCLVPIDRDDVHGFRVDAVAGLVHLPQGVCDRTTITGIALAHSPKCASKDVRMPIDGAGANCIDDGDPPSTTPDAGVDAETGTALVTTWLDEADTAGVGSTADGELAVLSTSRHLVYVTTSAMNGKPIVSGRVDLSQASASTTVFLGVDSISGVVYATFDDATILPVPFTAGKGFGTMRPAITNVAATERIGFPVAACIVNAVFPSTPTVPTSTCPSLTATGGTTATDQNLAPYESAFAFACSTDETAFGAFSTTVDGGAGTVVARGTPGNFIDLRATNASRVYGLGAAQKAASYRVVMTEAQADGNVHVVVVDGAPPGVLISDLGSLGPIDPSYAMRNIAIDGTSQVAYLTDNAGNLKYVKAMDTPPTMGSVDPNGRVCPTSLGVATDSKYVYRACSTGVTRDALVQ